ncbi:similar to Saccharomyces cerevisiae YKL006C-A SFT1 Intra-Golgi v-SNARE, required for transport of proteins between an early and a later Golgi compartment [Maudiozyma barnettii]|uniref:Similar to Saccharomyces cerevisiae YKL006C-A SFT1 Intra-Golgi v-SNARE, required for transport of proteins between an early and a later Golgi compartment n=1 Tax=Maudiozyma barnettii TaxID=61262 RepID=A0A8H2VKC2_9SACH|nr:Sft1p [Kazachstania barnettii]CAB4257165.1 similar to Saccharomyces cerevisiae YKL006C-A SFT1 Intra-Golgi v-SNARE, required for transport of proteins between an early and a later Golgi compartment [Kazachstania barnettii]CAD1779535.1 similar to Saccharomyces cerevisiae YKL006C-A SFT1 Intra-Golgi v-SNARE, required for transport of proteins between an early and a later Golgi compartment [Kazachstania barnettii]
MSNSRYSQLENDNDQKLNTLANKLATFRNINEDINNQAVNDNALLSHISNSFDSLANNIRNTSHRLTRTLNAGNNIWKMVGLALLIFFIIYNLFKLF